HDTTSQPFSTSTSLSNREVSLLHVLHLTSHCHSDTPTIERNCLPRVLRPLTETEPGAFLSRLARSPQPALQKRARLMPDPAVQDAPRGRLSTSSSSFPSLSPSAAEGPPAVSPGVASTSDNDHADESVAGAGAGAVASVKSSSAGAARPSLLSRLSLPLQLQLPLRSRNRNVADFHIRCDEPHKKYAAGDSVRGAVVLAVVKPLRITHLVVALHGYVRVLKDPTSVAKAQSVTILPPPGSSRRPQYQGNGVTSLFQDEQVLSGEGRIESGKYEFGFDLVFPDKWLPSSID
ncbi:hypothetical protein E4U43_006305, partial [Claviceps pusilla]